MNEHVLDQKARHIKETVKVGVKHIMPFFVFHPHQQGIFADACIVNKYLDVGVFMSSLPRSERFLDLLLRCDIEFQQFTVAACIPDLLQGDFGFLLILLVIDQHEKTHLCQSNTYRPSNTP